MRTEATRTESSVRETYHISSKIVYSALTFKTHYVIGEGVITLWDLNDGLSVILKVWISTMWHIMENHGKL